MGEGGLDFASTTRRWEFRTVKLPTTEPKSDPVGLWAVQLHLLRIAEDLLGPRDPSKALWQPQFEGAGPNVRFSLDRRSVFAELSTNGESYWPTALYELAHETVHLLDPGLLGTANYLEEGIAVAFSIYAQHLYCVGRVQTPSEGSKYSLALKLVSALPGQPLLCAGRIRRDVGRFSAVTPQDLVRLFPNMNQQFANALTRKFSEFADT